MNDDEPFVWQSGARAPVDARALAAVLRFEVLFLQFALFCFCCVGFVLAIVFSSLCFSFVFRLCFALFRSASRRFFSLLFFCFLFCCCFRCSLFLAVFVFSFAVASVALYFWLFLFCLFLFLFVSIYSICSLFDLFLFASRDAWVLTLMTIVVDKLSDEAQSEIGGILGRVFEPTLSMIKDDFTNYPVFLFDF